MLSGEIFEFKKKGEKCLSCGEYKARLGEMDCRDCENKYNVIQCKLQGKNMKLGKNGNLHDR